MNEMKQSSGNLNKQTICYELFIIILVTIIFVMIGSQIIL
jgi:hypothetical protein